MDEVLTNLVVGSVVLNHHCYLVPRRIQVDLRDPTGYYSHLLMAENRIFVITLKWGANGR
jgi:hypothetical protein